MPRPLKPQKSPLGALLESLVKEDGTQASPQGAQPKSRFNNNRNHSFQRGNRPQHSPRGAHAGSMPAVAGGTPPAVQTASPKKDDKRRGSTFQYSKFGAKRGTKTSSFRTGPAKETGQHGKRELAIAPPAPGVIRIIPLGGVEEIGKNMTLVEIGNDIIIIDAGFQFKTEDTPGIDYIVPNTK
jgi:hypothetical protein